MKPDPYIAETFARDLRLIRARLGISQAEAAGILGVQANSLARWERAERTPPGEKEVLTREGILRRLRREGRRKKA